jgi:hypothetical protein
MTPGVGTIKFGMWGLCNELVCLSVQAGVLVQAKKTLTYHEICQLPVIYRFAIVYSRGFRSDNYRTQRFIRLDQGIRKDEKKVKTKDL